MTKYKVNDKCIGCMACVRVAENHFALDENRKAYVTKQPESDDEISLVEKAMNACPTEAIERVEDKASEIVLGKHNVRETLEKYPQLKDVLLEVSPKFKNLLNPAMYNTAARFATFNIASKTTGVSLCEILHALNKELGLEKQLINVFPECIAELPEDKLKNITNSEEEISKSISESKIEETILDVRGMSEDPFDKIIKLAHDTKSDESFVLIQSFKPDPMIKMLTAMDFEFELLKETPGEVHMKFTKQESQISLDSEKSDTGGVEKPELTIQSATPVGYPIIMKLLQSKKLKESIKIKELKVWEETEKHLAWIVNSRADISFSATITATKFKESSVKMPVVFVWDNFVLLTRKTTAKNLSDLKGEKIRLPLFEDAPPAKITKYLLEMEGLKVSDFEFEYGNPFGRPRELMAAFVSDKVNHVLLREPEATFASEAAKKNGLEFTEISYGKLFNNANPEFGSFPNAGVIVKESLYKEYPEVMTIFEDELKSAIDWVNNNPREAAELSFDMMRNSVENVESFIKRVNFEYKSGEALVRKMENFYTVLSENNILPIMVDEKLLSMFKK